MDSDVDQQVCYNSHTEGVLHYAKQQKLIKQKEETKKEKQKKKKKKFDKIKGNNTGWKEEAICSEKWPW